jgi:hypothetical protein
LILQSRDDSRIGAARPSLLSATATVDAGRNRILAKLETATAPKPRPGLRALPVVYGWNAIGAGALTLVVAVAIWGAVVTDNDALLTKPARLAAQPAKELSRKTPVIQAAKPLATAAGMAAALPAEAVFTTPAPPATRAAVGGASALALAAPPAPGAGKPGAVLRDDNAAAALPASSVAAVERRSVGEMMSRGKHSVLASVSHLARKANTAGSAKAVLKHPAGQPETSLAEASHKSKTAGKDRQVHLSTKDTRLASRDKIKAKSNRARPKPEPDSDVALLAALVAFSQRSGLADKSDMLLRDSSKEVAR